MADIITVTVPELPALAGATGDELVAVWRDGRMGQMPQLALRGTRTFTGTDDPPTQPSVIMALMAKLDDRWRNSETGDEWKVTNLNPFTWTPDGNVKGAQGESGNVPGPPGVKGDKGDSGRFETAIAAEPVPNSTSVVDVGGGFCVPADPLNDAHFGKVFGFVRYGGEAGVALLVQVGGLIGGVGGDFTGNKALYIADGTGSVHKGGLTTTRPSAPAWVQQVGTSQSASRINYQLGVPFRQPVGVLPVTPAGVLATPGTGPNNYAAGDDPRFDAALNADSTTDARPGLTDYPAIPNTLAAPPKIKAPSDVLTIDDFDKRRGGSLERDKAIGLRDYQPVFQDAFSSGRSWTAPGRIYPIRSAPFTTGEGAYAAILVAADTPISASMEWLGRVRAGRELASIVNGLATTVVGNLFQFSATPLSPPSAVINPSAGTNVPLYLSGFSFDDSEIATYFAANGVKRYRGPGSGSGLSCIDISRYTGAVLQDLRGYSTRTAPDANDLIGVGASDTFFGQHSCFASRITNVYVEGFFDLGGYFTGEQGLVQLGTNPFKVTNGSSVVEVYAPNHRLYTGDTVWLSSVVAAYGISFSANTPNRVTRIDADRFSVVASGVASVPGGGTAMMGGAGPVLRPSSATKGGKQDGEGTVVSRFVARWCTNAISAKRNELGLVVEDAYIADCGNGVHCANVSGTPSFGMGLKLNRVQIYRTGLPIQFYGPDCSAENIKIRNFGKDPTGAAFIGTDLIAGINFVAAPEFRGDKISIKNEGPWKASAGDAKTTRAIVLQHSPMYLEASNDGTLDRLKIEGVGQGIFEFSTCGGNHYTDPIIRDTLDQLRLDGANPIYSQVFVDTRALSIQFDNGTTATLTSLSRNRAQTTDTNFVFRAFLEVASLPTNPAPSGAVTITGLPSNAAPVPITLKIERSGSSGAGNLQAIMQAGSGTVGLTLEKDGVQSVFTAGGAPVGARFWLSGAIPLAL